MDACIDVSNYLGIYITLQELIGGCSKDSESLSKAILFPAAAAAVGIACKYIPLLRAQFGRADEEVIQYEAIASSVPGCSNPQCGHLHSEYACPSPAKKDAVFLVSNCSGTNATSLTTAALMPRISALKKCGKCELQAYCSRECQVAHFKVHKLLCKTVGVQKNK
jgi:hypothetical protein